MGTEVIPAPQSETTEHILDSQQTTCCIVGGGLGGMMLALLLARKGVLVTVLEAHKDFDRDFRGDHPSFHSGNPRRDRSRRTTPQAAAREGIRPDPESGKHELQPV